MTGAASGETDVNETDQTWQAADSGSKLWTDSKDLDWKQTQSQFPSRGTAPP